MTPQTYRKLEEIFSRLNEALVDFYSSLRDLYPNDAAPNADILKYALQATGELYRTVSKDLFETSNDVEVSEK